MTYRPELAPLVEAVLPDGVRVGRAFGHPAYYVGRKMAASLMGPGLGLKLPRERCQELIADGAALPFEVGGKTMGGWVIVAGNPAAHVDLIQEAVDYVATLDPAESR